jgi:ubiquinone/menaquinone biosynthesis C-methylase UbiE
MKKITIQEAIKIQKDAKSKERTPQERYLKQIQFTRSIDTVKRLKKYFIGKVVEIGCELGHASLEIEKLGFEVVGVDLIDSCVKQAKEKGVNAILGSMENLPFKDKEFDTGLYSHVLEHSFDFEKAITEAKRIFKRLIIVVPINDPYNIPCHTSRIENEDIIRKSFPGKVVFEDVWYRLNWKNEKGEDTKEFIYIVDLK